MSVNPETLKAVEEALRAINNGGDLTGALATYHEVLEEARHHTPKDAIEAALATLHADPLHPQAALATFNEVVNPHHNGH